MNETSRGRPKRRQPQLRYIKNEIALRLEWSFKYRIAIQDNFLNKVRLYLKKQLVFSRIKEQVLFTQREMMKYIENNQTIFDMKNDVMKRMRKVIGSKNEAITYIHILLDDKLNEYMKIIHLKEQKRIQLEEGLFSKCENNVYIGVIPKNSDSIYKGGIESDAFDIKDLSKDLSYYPILQNYFSWENCISFE